MKNSRALTHPKYRSDIDGLRALAVLTVVGFHAFPNWIKGGFIGVDIFFVISGYLISTILFENLENHTFSFKTFYARRVKRIFPALMLVLLACFMFGWFALLADEYKQLGKHIAGGAGFISNILLWQETGYFDNASVTKPLMHLWSLGVEEQFYILWPLLLWAAWKKRVSLLALIVLLCALSYTLNIKGVHTHAVATFFSPETRFWELLSGSLLAWCGVFRREAVEKLSLSFKHVNHVLSIIGIIFITYGLYRLTSHSPFPGSWALYPTVGAMCLIAAGEAACFNRFVLSHRLMVWFGLISFPLYLWHWPILSFAHIIESGNPDHWIRLAAVLLSIVLAFLTYRWIEKPIRYGRQSQFKTLALIVFMIGLGGLGLITYLTEGFESRASIRQFVNNKNELIRTPAMDDACRQYIHESHPAMDYCRFNNVGSKTTVAVIGDSHAHVAYPGIAEYLAKQNVNTVLLANSGCPPFIGGAYGKNAQEKKACETRIQQIITTTLKKSDIHKVFIVTRGTVYLTGKYYGDAETGANKGPLIAPPLFKRSLQATIDTLHSAGKQVYYVLENPELPIMPNACMPRPLRLSHQACAWDLNTVLTRQQAYLHLAHQLQHAKVIDTLSYFCPANLCRPAQDGVLLYADYDHLSVAGSRYQVQKVLAKYL